MVHYAEKELIKKHKKKYKPKDGQYILDAGLKKFGDKGETAVTKELRQFNTYNVFEPLDATSLSESEKKGALSVLPKEQELIPEYCVNIFRACVRAPVRPSVPPQISVGCVYFV